MTRGDRWYQVTCSGTGPQGIQQRRSRITSLTGLRSSEAYTQAVRDWYESHP